MTNDGIQQEDVEIQGIYANDLWQVLFPKKPIFPYHLLVAAKRDGARIYTDLTDDEVTSLRDTVGYCVDKIREQKDSEFEGFNTFSNNGSEKIGQRLQVFHQHLFVRFNDEDKSPYEVLNRGERWHTLGQTQWTEQCTWLKTALHP